MGIKTLRSVVLLVCGMNIISVSEMFPYSFIKAVLPKGHLVQ